MKTKLIVIVIVISVMVAGCIGCSSKNTSSPVRISEAETTPVATINPQETPSIIPSQCYSITIKLLKPKDPKTIGMYGDINPIENPDLFIAYDGSINIEVCDDETGEALYESSTESTNGEIVIDNMTKSVSVLATPNNSNTTLIVPNFYKLSLDNHDFVCYFVVK